MTTTSPKEANIDTNPILVCSLCKQGLRSPRLLSCQHSFCTPCLEEKLAALQKGEQLKCPSCEKVIVLDQANVESLPENFLYRIMKESTGFGLKDLECFSCTTISKNTSSTHVCLDCGDPFCTSCKEWHCRNSVLKHHLVVSFEDMKERKYHNEWVGRKQIKCDKHSLPLKFYCEDCEQLVCNDCFILEHNHHTSQNWNEASEKRRPLMREKIGDISKTHKIHEERVSKAKEILDEMQQDHEKQKNSIYNKATEMHELVDKIKEEKLEELDNHYEKELKKINEIILKESNQENEIDATDSFANNFLKHSSDADFLHHEKEVNEMLHKYKGIKRKSYTVRSLATKSEEVDTLTGEIRKVFGELKVSDEAILQNRKLGKANELFKYQVKDSPKFVSGLAVDRDGNILVACRKVPKILVLTREGKHKGWIECDCEVLKDPWDVFVKGGDIYVTDTARDQRKVIVMNNEGKVKKVLKLPNEEQKFSNFVCITVNDEDRMIISSYESDTIYISDQSNDKIIPYITKQDQPDMSSSLYLHITARKYLVYRKFEQRVVEAYDENKELKWKYESQDGKKLCAAGICGDKSGNVYITDYYNPRIHVVNNGKPVGCIELGEHVKEIRPVTITENDELIYAYGNNIVKIAVWE